MCLIDEENPAQGKCVKKRSRQFQGLKRIRAMNHLIVGSDEAIRLLKK